MCLGLHSPTEKLGRPNMASLVCSVRMSLATGICEDVKTNKTSKRYEYSGRVSSLPAVCLSIVQAVHDAS